MKLKFKLQQYQTDAVAAVVDCFAGQPHSSARYRFEVGAAQMEWEYFGFNNADIQLSAAQVLANLQQVQQRQNLPLSDKLATSAECQYNFDIEMETGTGKTYCYLKTIFELNRCYGWNKYIVIVPSIAIREGVYKSLQITAEHFIEHYGKQARFFIYHSKRLHELESFSSDAGINIMVINIQAFNARGADNRRIYDELDDFQSRRPIDVLSRNRPILILDEPQKMEGKATQQALPQFKPLLLLRYSATHRQEHNKVHRLDALDAYNQKLVKKIAVRGIQVRGLGGTSAYLYLESIEISQQAPVARIELEVKRQSGTIRRVLCRLHKGDDLYRVSGGLLQYQGFIVAEIDYNTSRVEFVNGENIYIGQACGDVTEAVKRRIQIRETIKAHLDKEKSCFAKGIKVLSLFFIDTVAKYRDYTQAEHQGEYARIFAEEYTRIKAEYLDTPLTDDYRQYLEGIDVAHTHNGYFSIDKKSKRLVDPKTKQRSLDTDDVDAYDLILKDKERLLAFDEPIRFIFSHSALREGWDNPNVFVMCMLKHSDNTISRRQEVGRGLRLCVDQHGARMDNPLTVHTINVLTVVVNESYQDFVENLQQEIRAALSTRPRRADQAYFTGKIIKTASGDVTISAAMAHEIEFYLIQNRYVDSTGQILEKYHTDKRAGEWAALPETLAAYAAPIFMLIDSVYSTTAQLQIEDSFRAKINPLNPTNFAKAEFQQLWQRINRQAIYQVEFASAELINKCVSALNQQLQVTRLHYILETGVQAAQLSDISLQQGTGFSVTEAARPQYADSAPSQVKYNLIDEVMHNVQLTRRSVVEIFSALDAATFAQFKQNPEQFISEATRLIKEQKATAIIEQLTYDPTTQRHDIDIFTANQTEQDFGRAVGKLTKHIYDYALTDSKHEQAFVEKLEKSQQVVVYAKLPRGFYIPTPIGDYHPDWAISFERGALRYIYFVAETKGSMSSLQLREIESKKIECAEKFFERLNQDFDARTLRYAVIKDYAQLLDLVTA